MNGTSVSLRAPAKLNLGLGVTARRGDGYHELHTIFVTLGLADELEAQPVATEFSLSIETEPGLPGASRLDGDPAANLVLRAARLFNDRLGGGGAHFRLRKRIPVASGLGGGSSDAAAALLLLARLYPEAAAGADLPALGLELGSDIPFFLLQEPAALGRGRGERLEPLGLPARHVVVVHPGGAVTSGDAYAWLHNFSRRLRTDDIIEALENGTDPRLQNALQNGVVLKQPAVRDAIMALRATSLTGVLMSGSGPACFGLAAGEEEAAAAAAQLRRERPDWWVYTDVLAVSGP